MIAPVCFKHYFEDIKKLKAILPRKKEEDEITPSSNAETVKQIESSDVSVTKKKKYCKLRIYSNFFVLIKLI